MDINDLFNATTLVLRNYFLIAMGQKIFALEKNSFIKKVDNIHFFYKFIFVNTTFHKVHILTLKWKYLKHQH
jgi:hypothetical protein